MQEAFQFKRNSLLLLYGPEGVGKKSSVYWAAQQLSPEHPLILEVDAMLCSEENNFVTTIL